MKHFVTEKPTEAGLRGQTGWVNWPVRLPHSRWQDSGEGGMWVHAFWPCDFSAGTDLHDSFIRCTGPEAVIALPTQDAPIGDTAATIYDRQPDGKEYLDAGVPVLAAVCLGTTSISYVDADTGAYWQCTEVDLTGRGQALLRTLSNLYSRSPILVTYLDR